MNKTKKTDGKNISIKTILILALSATAIFIGVYYYLYFVQPKKTMLPQDVEDISSIQRSIDKLSDEDKKLLLAYLLRKKVSEIFSGAKSEPVTVGQAIDNQKEFVSQKTRNDIESKKLQAELERKRQNISKQIASTVTVAFLDKEYKKINYSDYINIKLGFKNSGIKDIVGIKGTAVFKDIFGDLVKKVNVSMDTPVPTNQTIEWSGSLDFNQFIDSDNELAFKDKNKINFEFEFDTIIFKDGSKISVSEN